jgi:hypothetical protein
MTNTRPPSLIPPYVKGLQELERGVRVPRTALQMHFVDRGANFAAARRNKL